MDGVTVLQVIPQYAETWGWKPSYWFVIAIFALMVVGSILLFVFGVDELAATLSVCAIIPVIALVLFASEGKTVELPTHYQVLVDDSVSMADFTEKYKIIEQQGITYIVEEQVTE